jgi:hypothetical protein
MKKIMLTVTMSLFCLAGMAQGIGFGLKAGANIANTDISSDQFSLDTKSKIGIHGGVFLTLMFSDKLGVQPEVLYSMQGSKYDIPDFEGELKLDYITIPLLLRYNFNEMISIHAGPQFSLLAKAEEEFDGDTQDIKDDFKGSDISGAFGLEVDLPAKLGFGARYVLGLSNVLEEGGSFGNAELKNGTIQVYIKFRILGGE